MGGSYEIRTPRGLVSGDTDGTSERGGQVRLLTDDPVASDLLMQILGELQVMNLHLSVLTEMTINTNEVG